MDVCWPKSNNCISKLVLPLFFQNARGGICDSLICPCFHWPNGDVICPQTNMPYRCLHLIWLCFQDLRDQLFYMVQLQPWSNAHACSFLVILKTLINLFWCVFLETVTEMFHLTILQMWHCSWKVWRYSLGPLKYKALLSRDRQKIKQWVIGKMCFNLHFYKTSKIYQFNAVSNWNEH